VEAAVIAFPELITTPDAELFGLVAARMFRDEYQRAVSERGVFRVALAGGTSPESMYRALGEIPLRDEIDWTRIHAFIGDERCVPDTDPERNDRRIWQTLLSNVAVPLQNVLRVDPNLSDAAERYEALIRAAFRLAAPSVPSLDLVILGMGTDGHTASLFPGHAALAEKQRLVVKVTGAPKHPPDRITFTLPLLNAARMVLFLAPREKRTVVAESMFGDVTMPISLVRPPNGRVAFLVDPPPEPPREEPKTAVEMA
jgi:6-phosphogluconolactonase